MHLLQPRLDLLHTVTVYNEKHLQGQFNPYLSLLYMYDVSVSLIPVSTQISFPSDTHPSYFHYKMRTGSKFESSASKLSIVTLNVGTAAFGLD
ncbi:hypothetical protein IF1G_07749 [Cordyceps javanica]|uniref:Uncharacterized protein n=1 Tax=Cordyceps javanica TaxID=43265 RepID=A0A545UX23_9HYPO|nr:hypothetical protein IF1G_07749 [Cordyceps javanica]TQW01685.1 hypothetical protein IF2G_10764 [Cordyceps javanica]